STSPKLSMANEQLQPKNPRKSPGLQELPQMEYSNPTLNDVRQQQLDTNRAQQYQTSSKDWNSLHKVHGPPGTNVNNGLVTASSMNNSNQSLVNEGLVTVPPQRVVTSGGSTDLTTMTGLQNASNLGQYAVKMPPGFGSVNNNSSTS
ncbi:10151_t:CDS:1, partial [Acaulospora morrowiae]